MKFGEKLIQAKIIDKAQLDAALRHQQQTGQRLGEALLELGYISEENLLRFLAKEFNTRYVSTDKLSRVQVPSDLMELVPAKLAEERLVFPLLFDTAKKTLGVVTSEPQNITAIEEVRIVSGMEQVQVYVALADAIRALVKKHYRGDINAFAVFNKGGRKEGEPPISLYADRAVRDDAIELEHAATPRSSGPVVEEPEDDDEPDGQDRGPSSWTRQIEAVRTGSLVSDNDFIETLNILVGLLEMQRSQLQGHSARVAKLVKAISERLGLTEREIHHNIIAAYLHDLGKRASTHLTLMSISDSEEHRKRAQRYHLTPARLFDSVHLPMEVNHTLGHLYESFDGTGLPEQLSGEGIPLGSRIVAAVDAFEDLVSNPGNPLGETIDPEQALAKVKEKSERLFDPKVVQMLAESLQGEEALAQLSSSSPLILVADPDTGSTSVLELKLVKQGFRVRVARDSTAAVEQAIDERVSAAIVEMRMQPEDGFSVVEQIHKTKKDLPIFMMAADPTSVAVNRAFAIGVVDFITKPYVSEVLVAKLQKEISAHRAATPAAGPSQEDLSAGVVIEVETESDAAPDGKTPVPLPASTATTSPPLDRGPGTSPGVASGSFSGVGTTKSTLSGALEGKTALVLIKALVAKKRTGRLGLRLGDDKGEIFIQAGQVFEAILGETQGEEAFLELAAWKDCVYQFDPSVQPTKREIKTPTPQLLQIAAMSLGT